MSDLPEGWEWTTLGELAAPEARAITDGPFGSNLTSNHYTDSGARVIRLQNIGDGDFRDAHAYIALDHFERLRAHEVREGDLLVASLGDSPPRCCLTPALGAPAIVKADCIRIRLASDVVPKWVLYSMLAPATKGRAKSLIKGVGRPRLGLAHIRALPVPLPPLAEQRRIVDAIDVQMPDIAQAGAALASAGGRLLQAAAAVRQTVLASIDSANGTAGVLGDVLERIEAGRSFGGATRRAEADEWGIVKVSAMTWGEFDETENKYAPADAVDPRYEIRTGDLLVSRANTRDYVGAAVLVGTVRPRLLLSDKSLRLVPRAGVDRRWLLHTLAAPAMRRYISEVATGTKDSMRNISQAALLRAPIIIPDSVEQRRMAHEIDARLDDLDRLSAAVGAAMARSNQLQRSILAEAYAGRLVPQDPSDEPAAELLARIRAKRPPTSRTVRR